MSRATRDSATARSLLARVESRSTGKLTVGAGAAEIAVYLLDGEVVAATATDDDRQVVRMLLALGEIDEVTAARISARLDDGGDAFQGLFGIGEILDHVLAERFRQNLADFLASSSAPRFLDQRALFVTNIQMGHDTRRLIDELSLQCDVSRAIGSDMLVVRGRADPGPDPQRRRIAASVGTTPLTVASLLDGLAVEPLRARVLVGELLATGVLLPTVSASAETEVEIEVEVEPSDEFPSPYLDEDTQSADAPPRTLAPGGRDAPSRSAGPGRPGPLDEARSFQAPQEARVRAAPATREPIPVPRAEPLAGREPREPAPNLAGMTNLAGPGARTPTAVARSAQPGPSRRWPAQADDGPSLPARGRSAPEPYEDRETAGPEGTLPAAETPATAGRVAGETTRSLGIPSTILPLGVEVDEPTPAPRFRRMARVDDDDEDVDDARTEQVDPRVYARQSRVNRGLADWLNRTEAESDDDDDVAIFSDHDHERGRDGTGQFGTDRHHLDRVEVGSIADAEVQLDLDGDSDNESDNFGESEIIEADEAPVTRYGAPVLTTTDALAKIDVTNEVLAQVSTAFDDAEGPGRGPAVLQLMVDGVPSQFAVVLHDLRVTDAGEIDSGQLLRNLDVRPATEHRQLLNNSLVDLIERALSAAADELPDDAIDDLLASVSGYRQRLGL